MWLYLQFTLSYCDVDEPLAERGLEVSYETARRWVVKFGPMFARTLRRQRPRLMLAMVQVAASGKLMRYFGVEAQQRFLRGVHLGEHAR